LIPRSGDIATNREAHQAQPADSAFLGRSSTLLRAFCSARRVGIRLLEVVVQKADFRRRAQSEAATGLYRKERQIEENGMSKPTVVVTRRWPEEVERRLAELFEVELNAADEPLGADGLKAALKRADAVFATVTDRIDAEVLAVEPCATRLIGNFGVGFNNIDVEAAKAKGITVTNTPEVLTDATADLAMTLLLMAARRTGEGERLVRAGGWTGWRPTQLTGAQVTGKTLGLIGYGRIGRAVAARAKHGFGMKILFFDPYPPADLDGATACGSIEEVLQQADFVSLHMPGGAENRHVINAERLRLMQPHAVLVNSARGDVIDEAALAHALEAGVIAAAGLDVFEQEPKVHPALLELENVTLLPHLGSATTETRVAMGMRVIENAEAFFKGETPRDKVA
jgi:lactate dehydrogenase-like 2-hydroxyacid dehydrogenase